MIFNLLLPFLSAAYFEGVFPELSNQLCPFQKGEVVLYTISADAFTGTPAVGKFVDATYTVNESAPATGFVGEIIEEVTYTNSTSYRILVREINKA